jgi:Ca-activated chloride channel family protein
MNTTLLKGVLAAGLASAAVVLPSATQNPPTAARPLTVQITSPLGRTGITGPTRIVARIASAPGTVLSAVQFFVDGKLVGEDKDGAPFAVDWVDENPFLPREIVVSVGDSAGHAARDTVLLRPLELTEAATVSSVLLEPSVVDATGQPVNGLTAADFTVLEDGVPQKIDMAAPDVVPATYTLLIDSSGSMARRMDFVRDAARQLPSHLRNGDTVIVAPFSKAVGSVTGPTKDRDTIVDAIGRIEAAGGTAILNALVTAAAKLGTIDSRHVLVLITDGYDEHSDVAFERALDAIKGTKATVYVIGIAGTAGVSLTGERLLKRLATETGGRAFFPTKDFQLTQVHGLIAADVQQRYVLTYTPSNQALDGTYRKITVSTTTPTHVVRARPGYFAPEPPPIRPKIELTIRDVNRRTVDVSLEDLVVLEDGIEQQVEAFQESTAPVSLMLVLDSSGSMKRDASALIEAARIFVDALPPKDSLGVMTFSDRPILSHDLSTDRDGALAAIDKYQALGGTALYDALFDSVTRLASIEGRRAVVVMTDGRDENNPGTAPGSAHGLADVLGLLKNSGTMVYAIGLGPNVDRETIEKVTKVSGGEAYYPLEVAELAAEYRRVVEDLRRRYVISYTSTNSSRDGAFRKVDVRSRREGVVISAQPGYRAPAK